MSQNFLKAVKVKKVNTVNVLKINVYYINMLKFIQVSWIKLHYFTYIIN